MNISLVHGFLPLLLVGLTLASVLYLFRFRGGTWRRQLLIGVPVTVAVMAVIAALVDGLSLIPYSFPTSFYAWFGLVVLTIAIGVIGWRSFALPQRIVFGIALLLTPLLALTLVNANYQYYPTVGSLFGTGAHHTSQQQLAQDRLEWASDASARTHGELIEVAIPGTVSHFRAREAYVWLPPAWFAQPRLELPVLEMLAGTPGGPNNWIQAGLADQTAARFAAQHDGLAPILVMPDSNGGVTSDTECVDSRRGNAETYLTVDVPAFIDKTFGPKPGALGIVGLSSGGECALMLPLRHPHLFHAFADFSGLTGPTVGETIDAAGTTRALFGGSTAAYDAHNPVHLLSTRTYPGTAGWFEVGSNDSAPLAAQRELIPMAEAAGVQVQSHVIPGGQHDFDTWAHSFADALPWLSYRLGLTPVPSELA